MKKTLLFLTILIAFSLMSVAFAANFSDLKGTKYEEPAKALSNLEIMNGYPDGEFKPNGTVDRQTLAHIILKVVNMQDEAEDIRNSDREPTYTDVSKQSWSFGCVELISDLGYMDEISDDYFEPDKIATNYDAIKALIKILGYYRNQNGDDVEYVYNKALSLKLFKTIGDDIASIEEMDEPLTRGNLLLLIWNAFNTKVYGSNVTLVYLNYPDAEFAEAPQPIEGFYVVANGYWEVNGAGGVTKNISLVGFDGEGADDSECSEGVEYQLKKDRLIPAELAHDAIIEKAKATFVWACSTNDGDRIQTIMPLSDGLAPGNGDEGYEYKSKYTIRDISGLILEDGKIAINNSLRIAVSSNCRTMTATPVLDGDGYLEGYAVKIGEEVKNKTQFPVGSFLAYDASKAVKRAAYLFVANEAESKELHFGLIDEYEDSLVNGIGYITINGEDYELDEDYAHAPLFEGFAAVYQENKGIVKVLDTIDPITLDDGNMDAIISKDTEVDTMVFTNGDSFDLEEDSDDIEHYEDYKVIELALNTTDDAGTIEFTSVEEVGEGLTSVSNKKGIRLVFVDPDKVILVYTGVKEVEQEIIYHGRIVPNDGGSGGIVNSHDCKDNLQYFPRVAATTNSTGHIAYYKCTKCNKLYSDSNAQNEISKQSTIIPKLPKPAHECYNCLQKIDRVEPTKTREGNIEYYRCTECGLLYSDSRAQEEIDEADTILAKLPSGGGNGGNGGGGSGGGNSGNKDKDKDKVEDKQEDKVEETKTEEVKEEQPKTENNNVAKFTDIKDDDWFKDDVNSVLEKGLFKGTTEKTFSPNSNMTRAMLVTVLYRMAGSPSVTSNGSAKFDDLDKTMYYMSPINWAIENEIVYGITETEFGTDNDITREQLITFLFRFANRLNLVKEENDGKLDKFADKDQIEEYAEKAFRWGISSGLVNGRSETELAPKGKASRAEVAAIAVRFTKMMENA